MLAVLGVVAAFLVVGCRGGGGEEAGGPPPATIVSDLPLQGSSRSENESIVNAINLALEQRNNKAGDVQIDYQSKDDATAQAGRWDEATCTENARNAAQNEEIVGWIGPFNSGCGEVQILILNEAGLAMVSPATAALGLTKPSSDPDEPEKYYPTGERNFTRLIVTHDKQARAGALWMHDRGVRSVYILDDQSTGGKNTTNEFEQTARELGMEVLGHEGIDVTFGSLFPSELPEKGQEFVGQYEERFGSGAEAYTANGYEAANVLLDAIDRAYKGDGRVTRAGVVRELLATKNYDGVLGTWSFEEDGDATLTEVTLQKVENGKIEFY